MNTKKKILIVEDEITTGIFLKEILEDSGYSIHGPFARGKDALDSYNKNNPDLILMDIILEDSLDGIDVAVEIRKTSNIPILYITANTDNENFKRAKKTVPHGFLAKPIDEFQLISTVEMAFERYDLQEAYWNNEKKYQALFYHMAQGFVILELHCNNDKLVDADIIDINQFALELFQITFEVGKNNSLSELFPTIDNIFPDWKNIIYETYLSGRSKKITIFLKGLNKWLKVLLYSPDTLKIAFLFEDITDQKNNEIEMQNAHNEIKNLLSTIDSILIGVSLKDKITHWNSVAQSTFGIQIDDAIGNCIIDLKLHWDWAKITEGISTCIIEKKRISLPDISYVNQENKNKILGLTLNPIIQDDEINGFLIFGKDISGKRNIEMQLLQDQKLKSIGELSSGIAHEINTPSQYVSNNLHFLNNGFSAILDVLMYIKKISEINSYNNTFNLLKEIKDKINSIDIDYISTEIPDALNQSIEGMNKIATIVKSMKSFVHPGEDERRLLKINDALEDSITISRNEWKYNSEIVTNFDESNPEFYCLPAEINQVLLNLIINASHTINEAIDKKNIDKGIIIISTVIKNNILIISISDNGMGIPQEVQNRVFDPFFTTKEVGKGTGQGLSISYSIIVEKYNGKLYYLTEEAIGTTFYIELNIGSNK